jgi:N-dimethylarginine dimethylaminohydrolase
LGPGAFPRPAIRMKNKTALMCPPTYFDVREVKNPHMRLPIDHVLAQHQWENLRRALQDSGVQVETIEPVPHLEDMVFSANQVFVGYSDKIGKFIVPSEMRYPSRQKEVPFYVEWFRERGYKIIALQLAGDCLEGHGDLIWHPEQARVWAGYGFRSGRRALDIVSAALGELGISVTPLQLVDEHFYHLDTCFCPLNAEAVLLFPDALSGESRRTISDAWKRVHAISREEAMHFIANGVVANGTFLTPHMTPNLTRILETENLKPVMVSTSEYEKSGGSVFCMKCFID